MQCLDKQFYTYFKRNMDALGMPAPTSLFLTATMANQTAKTLADMIVKYGSKVTVRELLYTIPAATGTAVTGAAATAELAGAAGLCLASAYLGAVIGSIIVATYSWSACHPVSQSEFFKTYLKATGQRQVPGWVVQLHHNNTKKFNLIGATA